MFEHDLFDVFSRTHPAIVPLLFAPGTIIPLGYGILKQHLNVIAAFVVCGLGFLGWTLIEYWLHRLLFHFPARGPRAQRIHFFIHGVHHQWPRDKYRLVMPPAVSVALYFLFGMAFHATLGPRWSWPFFAGFVAGYLTYDMTHYSIHHRRPKTRYGRALRRHHLLHHHKHESWRFGVSSPLWDWVFQTHRERQSRPSAG